MKKIKTISLILFLVVLHSISAEAILGPAMGMMYTHNLVTTDKAYQGLINNDKTLSYDNLAVAIATSEKYPYTGYGTDGYEEIWTVTSEHFSDKQFKLSIEADELVFVSDENPVYKRPFELYTLQRGIKYDDGAWNRDREYLVWEVRYWYSNYRVDENGTNSKESTARQNIRKIEEVSSEPVYFPEDNDGTPGGAYYRLVWRDIILQLPGKPTDGGVIVDDVFYPLIQGTYSARFDIEFEDTKTGEISRLPVVIPGIYDLSLTSPRTETSAAFTVTPDPSAVNLNIEQLVRNGNLQRVGSIDFLWREGKFNPSSQLDDGAGSYIFLSASSDPFTSEPEGFKLVHEDFVEGETAYNDTNSIDYYVVLAGNSEHAGIGETFYGDDYYSTGENKATKWIRTQCHKQLQPQQQDEYAHYHTYTGDISIRVEGNPDVTMLAKGQYSSTIYVHVVAEDIQ